MTPRRALRLALPALLVVGAVMAIRLFVGGATVEMDGMTYASSDLARWLDAEGEEPGARSLESFSDGAGVPCRAFLAGDVSGIACRERGGWHLRVIRDGVSLDDPAAVARTEVTLRQSAAAMAAQ